MRDARLRRVGGGCRLLRERGAAPPRASAGARAPGRGRAHLCAGSFAPRGPPWGSPPRPTAPRVLAVASAARPLSGIPVATPVGAARLLGRVRLIIPAARSRTARLPRVCGRLVARLGVPRPRSRGWDPGGARIRGWGLAGGQRRGAALPGLWFLSDAFY